jgi:hypothetical protein
MYLVYVVIAVTIAAFVGWLWWTDREFELPGEYWMAKGLADARGWSNDAELISIEGSFVRPDGVAELQRSGYGWRFGFRSSARADAAAQPAPKNAIPGAPTPTRAVVSGCFQYGVSRGSGRQSNLVRASGQPVRCQDRAAEPGTGTRAPPRCSVLQVWQRAKQQGAPDPAYAEITASLDDGAWRWHFRIEGHVELEFADDC